MKMLLTSYWSQIVWLGIVAFLMGSMPLPAYGYVFTNTKRGMNLVMYGLGEFHLNYAFLDGNAEVFADSEHGFAKGFDTQEFLSLMVDGTVFRDYTLEGYIRYNETHADEKANLSDWQFRLTLSRDKHYVIVGDQEKIFSDVYFPRYTSPFRGVTVHAENPRFANTTLGALTQGTLYKDELSADGTSGPYQLAHSPVVAASEWIVLEVRNRNNQQIILDRIPQERGVDYTMNYRDGKITFTQPIAAETFQGDPIAIVAIYRSEAEAVKFNMAVFGSRTTAVAASWATLGVTYLSEFPKDDVDLRQEIYGLDGTFALSKTLKMTTEYAVSRDRLDIGDNPVTPQAFRATLNGTIGQHLSLQGNYHRTEQDFLRFANPDLKPDQQEFNLTTTTTYRKGHLLKIGYRFWQDNVHQEQGRPTMTTHRPSIAWEAEVRKHTKIFTKYEFIHTTNDLSPKTTDTLTQSILLGGTQEFLGVPRANKLTLIGEYQLDAVDDQTNALSDTNTHQIGAQLRADPDEKTSAYMKQRERWLHNKDLGENTQRHDISEVGIDLRRWQRFSVKTDYTYHVIHNLLEDEQASTTYTITLRSLYKPVTQLSSSGKIEFRKQRQFSQGESLAETWITTDLTAEALLLWTVREGWLARLRYEYDCAQEENANLVKTIGDTTELQMQYTFGVQKNQLIAGFSLEHQATEIAPAPEKETRILTYLVSGSRQFTDRWEGRAQYKREVEAGERASVRNDLMGEAIWKMGAFVRLASGYQYSMFENERDAERDYTSHSVYVKMIGKL